MPASLGEWLGDPKYCVSARDSGVRSSSRHALLRLEWASARSFGLGRLVEGENRTVVIAVAAVGGAAINVSESSPTEREVVGPLPVERRNVRMCESKKRTPKLVWAWPAAEIDLLIFWRSEVLVDYLCVEPVIPEGFVVSGAVVQLLRREAGMLLHSSDHVRLVGES